ncbi:metallophosphoesterase family protein [candidate division KSB1 bacterium]|nr:metallophosphoesterase family protein [candidate division KSB1 bacterium]RQW03060.1 MAG: metallophosphoesterase [candidate division KSB1 bacterium]
MATAQKIGIISDTHGVLPAKVFDLFANVERIIHAGDVGNEAVLHQLQRLAPVYAIRGNMDGPPLNKSLPERLDFQLYGYTFAITHIPGPVLTDEHPTIQINGHTHRACVERKGLSLLINPGSASRPLGSSRASVALLVLSLSAEARAEIIYL